METGFQAARASGNTDPSLAYIIAVNEINWILHEATTVLYSLLKTTAIIRTDGLRRFVYGLMGVSFVIFAALRINIGRLRYDHNTLGDADIAAAHSYAFIVWGLADLFVLIMLLINVAEHIKTSGQSVSISHKSPKSPTGGWMIRRM
jgi:hypothetical protein